MTVNVTDTIGANNTIVLDGNSKIPAIDGSQVTALSASAFTTGSLATARIDVGTTAGKVLQLDGSARIPALSGANLTNIPRPTNSTSNPTISTNLTLGAKWINKTSGEVYICTDATAGENTWANVGGGTGNIPLPFWPGETYSYCAGGFLGGAGIMPTNNIHRFPFASDANSTDTADMIAALRYIATMHSTTAGYVMGGTESPAPAGPSNDISKFIYSTEANMTDVGNLPGTSAGEGSVGVSSKTHGYRFHGGGTDGNAPYGNDVEKFAFSTDGNATDIADMLTYSYVNTANGNVSETHGYIGGGGGNTGAPYGWQNIWNTIQKMPFASDSNAVDSGQDLLDVWSNQANISSVDYGWCSGGRSGAGSTTSNTIQKFPFASSANATDIANLTLARHYGVGTGSHTYGYTTAGKDSTNFNVIDKFSFSSGADATDVGDINISGTDGPGRGAGGFHV